MKQEVRFCAAPDGVNLAYAVHGTAPPLVRVATWLTHLDFDWASPVWRHWLATLGERHTVVRYDERGCGLSDRDPGDPSLETWVADLEAVVDAAGLDRFALLGAASTATSSTVPPGARRGLGSDDGASETRPKQGLPALRTRAQTSRPRTSSPAGVVTAHVGAFAFVRRLRAVRRPQSLDVMPCDDAFGVVRLNSV